MGLVLVRFVMAFGMQRWSTVQFVMACCGFRSGMHWKRLVPLGTVRLLVGHGQVKYGAAFLWCGFRSVLDSG